MSYGLVTQQQGDLYALDIETTGLDFFKDGILGVGLYRPGFSRYFTDLREFGHFLVSNPKAKFVLHRGAFDINFLLHHGLDLRERFAYDTRSLASVLVPSPAQAESEKHALSLQNLGMVLLGLERWKLDREDMASYSLEEIERYCLKDCEVTWKLFEYLQEELGYFDPNNKAWDFVESWLMPATRFCQQLEFNGVYIDQKGLKIYQAEVEKKRDETLKELNALATTAIQFFHEQQVKAVSDRYKEMYEKAKAKAKDKEKCRTRYQALEELAISKLEPFNWNSHKQLLWLFEEYFQLEVPTKLDPLAVPSIQFFNKQIPDKEDLKKSLDEASLKKIDHPVAKKLVDYRELEKLCSTCIPALLENLSQDGCVHANYNVGGTRTGRLSSSGPNLQQIPKGPIRSHVRATAAHTLVTIDYSQIEVRIIAELAQEKELIHAFQEKIDPYSVIAQKLLKLETPVREIKEKHKKERDVSKTAGLSILYGTGAAKLQEVLKKELGRDYTLGECRQFISDYRESLPGVKALRSRLDRTLANGKVAYNLLGRPFHISSNDDIYMKGLNTLVQGSASDLVIWSQTQFVIPTLKTLGVNFKHRMLIHDEVVLELMEDEAELIVNEVILPAMTTEIEQALNLTIPLAVEYNISREWAKP